jgi:ParB family chromosome partitioning protein
MTKNFAPRITRKDRAANAIAPNIDEAILRMNDEKLLRGAKLADVDLTKITVREQVRTKFNDDSIRELAENIRINGLIQPLVIYRENDKFVLICGERRFRAMSTLAEMKTAPCFILENKTPEELMAIQFSENSSREELHYIDQADSICNYKKVTGASERKITAALGISKSEVHRCVLIGRLPKDIKEAAKTFNTEKYVLLEWDALENSPAKKEIREKIIAGDITKRSQLQRAIKSGNIQVMKAPKVQTSRLKQGVTASMFLKAMQSKVNDLDPKMKKMMENLVAETKEMIDM